MVSKSDDACSSRFWLVGRLIRVNLYISTTGWECFGPSFFGGGLPCPALPCPVDSISTWFSLKVSGHWALHWTFTLLLFVTLHELIRFFKWIIVKRYWSFLYKQRYVSALLLLLLLLLLTTRTSANSFFSSETRPFSQFFGENVKWRYLRDDTWTEKHGNMQRS